MDLSYKNFLLCNFSSQKFQSVSHTAVDYRRYVCYWCDRRYDMLSSLKAHVPSHLEQARPQCNICHKTYYSKSSLRDHMRIHTGERPYVCKQCGKRFITSGKLGKHMRWHNKDFRHSCNVCGKVFLEAYTLRVHMKVHEKKDAETNKTKPPKTQKMWNCKKCDAGFTRRDDLRLHNRDIHKIQRSTTLRSSTTQGIWTITFIYDSYLICYSLDLHWFHSKLSTSVNFRKFDISTKINTLAMWEITFVNGNKLSSFVRI